MDTLSPAVPLSGAGAQGSDIELGVTFSGVSQQWKKGSAVWFAGAVVVCVVTHAKCWVLPAESCGM